MGSNDQSTFFKGVYEFEDPSGTLIATKSPATGSADLYDGTAIVVNPNQCAILLYKGEIADILPAGTHFAKTENIPIVTRLANWRFGGTSPLRCEIWFFSGNVFTARRWGTSQPVVTQMEGVGPTPLRAYGNFNLVVTDPKKLYLRLIGSRTTFDITDLEEFVQGQILELLPSALGSVKRIEELGPQQEAVARKLEQALNRELGGFGVQALKIQVLSILPPPEVIQALDARVAMKVIGNQKEYLLYKAANSLDAVHENGSGDSMHMMLGLMLGKGLMGADFREKEEARRVLAAPEGHSQCTCGAALQAGQKFCANCGRKL
jgi:membrane protease subunit (stomatin/prohibitin family)